MQFYMPGLIIMVVLIVVPVSKAVLMAFSDWNLLAPAPSHPFVGLKNFREIVSMTHFWKIIWVTIVYTLLSVAGKMFVGLGLALLLNRDFIGRSVARGLIIIPWAMPNVVSCTVFLVSLDPAYGLINKFLRNINLIEANFSFFSRPESALITVIIIAIWKYSPFVTIMILAELQNISKDLYDSASIDGAGMLRKFTNITWPLIQPVWRIVLILQIIWTMREFELVYLLTNGGPDNGTAIMGIDTYRNAFKFFKVGAASAESMFLLVFALVFAYFYIRSVRKNESN